MLNILLVDVGLEWPPPEFIIWDDDTSKFREAAEDDPLHLTYQRTNMSQITDEQMKGMTYVERGAEYHYKRDKREIH